MQLAAQEPAMTAPEPVPQISGAANPTLSANHAASYKTGLTCPARALVQNGPATTRRQSLNQDHGAPRAELQFSSRLMRQPTLRQPILRQPMLAAGALDPQSTDPTQPAPLPRPAVDQLKHRVTMRSPGRRNRASRPRKAALDLINAVAAHTKPIASRRASAVLPPNAMPNLGAPPAAAGKTPVIVTMLPAVQHANLHTDIGPARVATNTVVSGAYAQDAERAASAVTPH